MQGENFHFNIYFYKRSESFLLVGCVSIDLCRALHCKAQYNQTVISITPSHDIFFIYACNKFYLFFHSTSSVYFLNNILKMFYLYCVKRGISSLTQEMVFLSFLHVKKSLTLRRSKYQVPSIMYTRLIKVILSIITDVFTLNSLRA